MCCCNGTLCFLRPQDINSLYQLAEQRLKALFNRSDKSTLRASLIGLEKETLRVNPQGGLAQTPHPSVLGSALTNPHITTDYSEALLEIVTPPSSDMSEVLDFLSDTQRFIYTHLSDELLWATSMPCVVAGETSIPIAKYGSSNAGLMKTIYRRGLGLRYGRVMQVIAGVHFNFSFTDDFWSAFFNMSRQEGNLQELKSENYFALIRNLQRFGWLIPYLFGASPAVCKSFLQGKKTTLQEFNETTYYEPYATSLRMGDIGYQNNKESEVGVEANYSSLQEYINSLQHAIETPCPEYEKLGVEIAGKYQQLSANILQIENEYYSTVRPKQITHKYEKPIEALRERGVRYVELRSLDVNASHPLGINEEQLYFLQILMLFCLCHESPVIDDAEKIEIDDNEMLTAHQGRNPELKLTRSGQKISIKEWGGELMQVMQGYAELLDDVNQTKNFSNSLKIQLQSINDPECTPSAKMLNEMRENNEGFYHYAMRMSQRHQKTFTKEKLADEKCQFYGEMAKISLQKQKQIEAEDHLSFEEFITRYFVNSLSD